MYKEITCVDMSFFMEFLDTLNSSDTDVWIRAVIIPGINDNIDYIKELEKLNYYKK